MIVITISGKRCSGKDLFAKLLEKRLNARIRALADVFKEIFAQRFGLDAERLKHDRAYKEIYRPQMLACFEEFNHEQPKLLVEKALAVNCEILIISDVRLMKDLIAIQQSHPTISVYIQCDDQVRSKFGWVYDSCIDENFTEIEMEPSACDVVIENNGDFFNFEAAANELQIYV